MIEALLFGLAMLVIAMLASLRSIGHDEHYGNLGCGEMTMSGIDTFSSALLPTIVEPDIIIKTSKGPKKVLDIDIDDILVWDCKRWMLFANVTQLIAGGEDSLHVVESGITHDNTSEATLGPTAHSFPSGEVSAVVGGAGVASNVLNGDESPLFEAFFDLQNVGVEEQTAVGQIIVPEPRYGSWDYTPYTVDGNTVHRLLTAAHYWLWGTTVGKGASGTFHLGAEVRRMSVDVEEMMFDRNVLLSILDALVVSS